MRKLLAVTALCAAFAADGSAACDFQSLKAEAVKMLQSVQVKAYGNAAYRQFLVLPDGTREPLPRDEDYRFRQIPLAVANGPCTADWLMTSRRIRSGRLSPPLGQRVGLAPRNFRPIWNDFNTQFELKEPDAAVILLKWRFYSRKGYVFYVPYSIRLAKMFPELATAGRKHLQADLAEALTGLEARNLLEPGTAELAEELGPLIYSSEGIDPYEFKVADDQLRRILSDQPFVTMGANGNEAYIYKVSSAGAKGPMQIWNRTCRDIRNLYPGAGLDRNCNGADWGSHSHIGNVAAFVLELQMHRDTLVRLLGESVANRPDFLRMLAASYNGGPGWVVQGYRLYGDAWDKPGAKRVFRKVKIHGKRRTVVRTVRLGLRPETVDYLLKCDFLNGLWEDERAAEAAIGGGGE